MYLFLNGATVTKSNFPLVIKKFWLLSHIFLTVPLCIPAVCYLLLLLLISWCPRPPVTAAAPCLPPLPPTACWGAAAPGGVKSLRCGPASSWSTLWTLEPTPSGPRSEELKLLHPQGEVAWILCIHATFKQVKILSVEALHWLSIQFVFGGEDKITSCFFF